MVVFLAGLQGIPPEQYEAAEIDGAGSWARFRHVTLPHLRPTTTFLLVVLTIGGLNAFISIFVISSAATGSVGGPLNSTDVVLTYLWKQSFAQLDLGYGAAVSFLLAIVVGVVSLVELRIAREQAS
jgi:multiple sugar transport system permease protein